MKKNINQVNKTFLIMLIFTGAIFSGTYIFASILPLDKLNHDKKPDGEIEKLEDEQEAINNTIEETKAQYQEQVQKYSKQEQELAFLQDKIANQLSVIEETEIKIRAKIVEVDEKKLEVENAQKEVDEHIVALRKRLRTMYKFGKTGYLQIILKSESLVNALTRLDRIRFLTEYDRDMLENLKLLKESLLIKQKSLELEQKELEDLKEEQIQQKEALELSYEQELVKKQNIFNNIEVLERQKEQLEAESRQIAETLRQMRIKRDYVGGTMAWPLDLKNNIITSFFGKRRSPIAGASTNHGAIDIAAPTGDNIYSALAGEVIASEHSYGYGNFVMVDHGGGIVTLYAHASERLVIVGDEVAKGEVIAKVGSTGISTGPHLHFEVRVNGSRVDPLDYVVAP